MGPVAPNNQTRAPNGAAIPQIGTPHTPDPQVTRHFAGGSAHLAAVKSAPNRLVGQTVRATPIAAGTQTTAPSRIPKGTKPGGGTPVAPGTATVAKSGKLANGRNV